MTRYPALSPLSVAVQATPLTIPYKQIGDLSLYIDIYSPTTDADYPVPAVIFFHGGGMTVGDRTSWLPIWLCSSFFPLSSLNARPEFYPERTIAAGFAFISADYRLLAPSTGHDVLEDVIDLFAFLTHTPRLGTVHIDITRLAVAGSSAGALCAFLSVGHANPKPRAVLSLYCFGGDLMVSCSTGTREA
jgi:acetyl esterase/lipase